MKNFKEIAEQVLNGEIKGYFVMRNGNKVPSCELNPSIHPDYPYFIKEFGGFDSEGHFVMQSSFDIIDFTV